ncbi:MAG TPA: DNA-binding protein [Herpetosiphonaceae bacterium]
MSTEQNDQRQTPFPKVGNPALRALEAAGYTHLEQLAEVGEAELLRLHGMGPKGTRILRAALAERGLSFADEKHKR